MWSSFASSAPGGDDTPFGGGPRSLDLQTAAASGRRIPGSALTGMRVVLAVALLLVVRPVPAHPQADAIRLRKDNFHVLSAQMKDIVQGLGNGLPVSAMQNRVAVADQALRRLPNMFPPGSDKGDTNARAAIWAEPQRFKAVYDAALADMSALVAAAAHSDRSAFGAAVGRMAAACGDCHAAFRAK